ncbi:putative endo-1,3(4)-beta-glucanase [Xylariaceae sp. FL1272]|nr:putative endo-1,3(4)-beta-glucanase [Xylariaceae sp. FL1272]
MFSKVVAALALAALPIFAQPVPDIPGFKVVWQINFQGAKGGTVSTANWNIIQSSNNANAELETYTKSNTNHHLSGDGSLLIIPHKNAQGAWTSARLESKYTFTPKLGKRTIVQAKIRFGKNAIAHKQGIWPAFWMLGDSIRHGTPWPACGEIDILETVNGALTGYGTVHCDVYPGGICNEGSGLGGTVSISDQGWHTWRVIINRTHGSWMQDFIVWERNGVQFEEVSGARIGNQSVWQSLVNSPLYIILNVAVGGTFPGNPNANTQGGLGSAMEVGYVAHYQST